MINYFCNNVIWKMFIAILIMYFPNIAMASTAQMGNVSYLVPVNNGPVFFNQSGIRTASPVCATNSRWVIDASNAAGQAIYATILMAYSMNKSIEVQGTGTCTISSDTETVGWVIMP